MDVSDDVSAGVTITANGDEQTVPADTTVADLLEQMDIDPDQSGIAVAVDDAVVPRAAWMETTLTEGARVEVITATQGG